MSEFINKDDLMVLRQLKTQFEYDVLASEKAVLKSQASDLNYQNSVLKVYLKYGMKGEDSLDYKDGKIIRKLEREKEKEEKYDRERENDVQPQDYS